jgi:hypothetical protein
MTKRSWTRNRVARTPRKTPAWYLPSPEALEVRTLLSGSSGVTVSSAPNPSRVANLSGTGSGPRNNGNDFLIASGPNATVFDDSSVDVLNGGSGTDWFFANQSGGVAQDIIKGLGGGQIVEELDVLGP